jgi:hypothetical protein
MLNPVCLIQPLETFQCGLVELAIIIFHVHDEHSN